MIRAFICALGLLAALTEATPVMLPGKNATLSNIAKTCPLSKVKNAARQFTAEAQPQISAASVAGTATETPVQTPTMVANVSSPIQIPMGTNNTIIPGPGVIPTTPGQGGVPPIDIKELYKVIFSGKNFLVKDQTGQSLEPSTPPPGGLGPNMTAGGRILDALFGRPLNQSEYYERNWMWIRCRAQMSTKFDVGGGWVRDYGRNWFNFLNKQCLGIVNWRFEFANGGDWGDAEVSFNYFWPGCTVQHAVRSAIDASREESRKERRQLYVYGCPGFDSEPWSFLEVQKGQRDYDPTYQNPSVPPALQQAQGWFGTTDPRTSG